MKEFNMNDNSTLQVNIVIKEWTDEKGRLVTQTQWIKAEDNINLGSTAKPNKNILAFRYDIPDDKPLFKRLFGND